MSVMLPPEVQATPRLIIRTISQVMPILIRKMHEFCIEADVTLEEWMAACNMLAGAGKVTTDQRHEVVLVSDIFGIESLVGVSDHRAAVRSSANVTLIVQTPSIRPVRRGQPRSRLAKTRTMPPSLPCLDPSTVLVCRYNRTEHPSSDKRSPERRTLTSSAPYTVQTASLSLVRWWISGTMLQMAYTMLKALRSQSTIAEDALRPTSRVVTTPSA